MSRNSKSNDSGMGCVLVLVMMVLAMPIVGLYLAFSGKSSGQKGLGVVLFVVSIIVYAKYGLL